MTQNEVSIIKNSVLDATEAYVDARLAVADFVKTQIGVVVSSVQNTSNKKWYHTVRCNATQSNPNGITYTDVLSINNIHFTDNSVVFVIAPNAQFSNQFILGKLDNVPYDLSVSGIDIGGGTFVVNSHGHVTIKDGEINLTLKQDSRVSDDTYNIILNANGEQIGAYVKDNGTSASPRYTWEHYFNVDSNGNVNITKGSISIGGNFSVNSSGVVTIKSGSILLGATTVGGVSGYNVNLTSSGINLGLTGGTTSNPTYNFTVNSSGVVTIKSGSINLNYNTTVTDYGFIVDSNGIKLGVTGTTPYNKSWNFTVDNTGIVTIKSGSILLGANGSNYNVNINSTGIGLGWDGSAHTFTVSNGGVVTIKRGEINLGYSSTLGRYLFSVTDAGYLHAESGQIGGATIYADRLQYTASSIFSKTVIGCGDAGSGTVTLCGNSERGTTSKGGIIICNQYDITYNRIEDGLWIDGGGTVRGYDGSGNEIWYFNLANGDHGSS